MEFCSKYGYDYGFSGSDSEELSDDEPMPSKTSTSAFADGANKKSEPQNESKNKSVSKKVRKADSNIIAVKFDELVHSNETFAGEPKRCTHCTAIVSASSKAYITQVDNKFIWNCEFCATSNDLSHQMMQSLNEVPSQDDVTFLIEPAPPAPALDQPEEATSGQSRATSLDDKYLTYCIDISGSMDTKIHTPDNESSRCEMSRLKGVKVACLENLSNLKETEPNKKCSLVTFSDAVKFYGDGNRSNISNPLLNVSGGSHRGFMYQQPMPQQKPRRSLVNRIFSFRKNSNPTPDTNNNHLTDLAEPETDIAIDIMTNKEKMLALAQNQDGNLRGVAQSYENLKDIVKNLKTEGSTG